MSTRAGNFITQPSGYKSFVPKKLPPDVINYDPELISLLSSAHSELGRLDGITQTLPNPDLFVSMYVKKEAVLSSQIEGTQASLTDVLRADTNSEKKADIQEIVHYVKAMNYGLQQLSDGFPLSLRLIKEIHAILLETGRGSERNPGEFRTTQNWVGSPGSNLLTASYVPPSVPDMQQAIGDLELYLHEEDMIPPLVKIALIHSQFETIHPFLDGNGRAGRLLITFWLCYQKILSKPLLYLSYYFKYNRREYYDRLTDVRQNGNWEDWIKFFLRGVVFVSEEATTTAKKILLLKDNIETKLPKNKNSQILLDYIFTNPIVTAKEIQTVLGISSPTVKRVVESFTNLKILKDLTPDKQRNKVYDFADYIEILEHGTELDAE